MNRTAAVSEGFVRVRGGRVWCRMIGDGPTTLLLLHGGPGAGSAYLGPLEDLAPGIRVAFYDQLGCGRSDRPADRNLWHVERFVEEVEAVRTSLNLGDINLLGHSWGGMLAIEYALAFPERLTTLVLSNTLASMPLAARELQALVTNLPPSEQHPLLTGRLTDVPCDPDVARAARLFDSIHICRLAPWPDELRTAFDGFLGRPVYHEMWGDYFLPTGSLRDWDRSDKLKEIKTRTLITVGRFDAITPRCSQEIQTEIENSVLHVFENSSHTPHYEERDAFVRLLADFLHAPTANAKLN